MVWKLSRAPATAKAPRLLPSAELRMNCEPEIVTLSAGKLSMAPPTAAPPPPLLAWLPVNEQLRTAKLTLLASSIAPPAPSCWPAPLPPVAVLFAKVHWDKVVVMTDPLGGVTNSSPF